MPYLPIPLPALFILTIPTNLTPFCKNSPATQPLLLSLTPIPSFAYDSVVTSASNISKPISPVLVLDFPPKLMMTFILTIPEPILLNPDSTLFFVSTLVLISSTLVQISNNGDIRVGTSNIGNTSTTSITTGSVKISAFVSTSDNEVTGVGTSGVRDTSDVGRTTSFDEIFILVPILDDGIIKVRASGVRDTSTTGRTTSFMDINRDIIQAISH